MIQIKKRMMIIGNCYYIELINYKCKENFMESNKTITVAIIDGGLDPNEFNVKSSIGFRLNKSGDIEKVDNPKIENNHGIIVAKCIKHIYKNVEFIDLNILDSELSSNGYVFLKALQYCEKEKPDIINLSLGTTKKRYFLAMKKIIKRLNKQNVIVVAAENNGKRKSYPANIRGVIGVKGNELIDCTKYIFNNGFYYTSSKLPKTLILKKQHEEIQGNSLACGFMTGHICKAINAFEIKSVKTLH